ncbi:unnamed protein product [Mycena citricolor]|uniref:Ricin B lectin domain-containing protein n=1 Tax=Mycena citricolor TaxID=2018698 RepID=A0AAD2H8F5_9AGAR|nr:unnamed protein product [Mycena citricolor]
MRLAGRVEREYIREGRTGFSFQRICTAHPTTNPLYSRSQSHSPAMFVMQPLLALLLSAAGSTYALAPTTLKIQDYQSRMLELAGGSSQNLTRVQAVANSSSVNQNWKFYYSMSADSEAYQIVSGAPSANNSILWHHASTGGKPDTIAGVQDTTESTFWDIHLVQVGHNGYNILDKATRKLAITSSAGGMLTLETREAGKKEQQFQLLDPSA